MPPPPPLPDVLHYCLAPEPDNSSNLCPVRMLAHCKCCRETDQLLDRDRCNVIPKTIIGGENIWFSYRYSNKSYVSNGDCSVSILYG